MKSPITTHVLDTAKGRPAAGIPVTLEVQTASGGWKKLGSGTTNVDGRVNDLLSDGASPGIHKLTFDTALYFRSMGVEGFYPYVSITFEIKDVSAHCHIPLLLSPFGYSTYRGS